ncbi:hypothetical protein BLA29_014461 [Euroglyphus maynei]|uniref:Uncharacterized protein n=1 Tax=Euroglyphus maynei TaxID=6958 RepID=A0A1Y3ASD3_EURMA|nr:hypothetical protein BLA29_014461 [Euroglyphus maynei]
MIGTKLTLVLIHRVLHCLSIVINMIILNSLIGFRNWTLMAI